jgi:hypothetical protein
MKSNDLSRSTNAQSPIMRRPLQAALLALSLALGCSGKTSDSQTALSTCGSSCSVSQVTDSCSVTCSKMIQTGCYKNNSQDQDKCTRECVDFGKPSCPKAIEFLRCAESVNPTCVDGDPDFGPTCAALLKEADKCQGMEAVPVPGVTGAGGGAPVPDPIDDNPGVCPNIPRRTVGGGACTGGGRAPDGTDAALECTSSCQDSVGNLWEATCNGTTCACSYNRTQMCTCTITADAGACPSCCPGTTSP